MVYRKTYKKKQYKKKPWYNRKYTPAEVAYRAYRGVRYLKGLVNSELLKSDTNSNTTISNSGTIIRMVDIAQGDGDGQRTGNSILIRSINLKMAFFQHASATDTLYRVILLQDKQQQADTNPTVADILESTSTLSPLNSDTVGRFKILKNWFFHTSDASDTVKHFNFFLNLRQHMRYNGSASTDYQKDGIYLLLLSDQSTNTPTIYYNKRVSYHDN